MEVDSHSQDNGVEATSPPPSAEASDKVNGEEETDFTITMNESDGEGSNGTPPSSQLKKVAVKPDPPAQVNGKSSSDDDSQTSLPKKTGKAGSQDESEGEDSRPERENGEEEGTEESREEGNTDSAGAAKEAEDKDSSRHASDSEDKDNTTMGETEEDADNDKKQSDAEANESDSEEKGRGDSVKEKTGDSETQKDSDQKKKHSPTKEETEERDTGTPTKEADNEENDHNETSTSKKVTDNEETVEGDESTPKKKTDNKSEAMTVDDDDVVEIEDSPMKTGDQASSFSYPGSGSGATSMVLDARTGASVPFTGAGQGTSLMPSTSGVQLLLSQGAAALQGSGMMNIPNSATFLSTSVANMSMQSQAALRNSNPHLLSQYPGMASYQANRFATTQQGQGLRMGQPNISSVLATIPEKPTSSKGMIDMIRWEVENHINIKPKYVRPNPKAELGNLAKWTFDLGSDLVKEYVYHDLVRIQHRRKDEGNLSDKEKADFAKLQQIDKELNQKVGHLKYKLNKSCKCGFKTELDNVMYLHQQSAHLDRGGFLSCPLCKYSTRQPNTFRGHMESEHGRVGKTENRPSFYECPLCPYESNYTNRLDQHKVRCQRQFREAFNLHPSCLTGPEVNLCLENVFYFVFTRQFMNSIIPPTSTNAVAKAADVKGKQAVAGNSMLTRKGTGNAQTNSVPSTAKHLPPIMAKNFRGGNTVRQQLQTSNLSHNYPVISSKINPNQITPAFVAAQAAAIAKQAMAARAPVPNQAQNRAMAPNQPPVPNQSNNAFEVCEICGGYVKDRKALRIHFFYAHRIDMPFGVFERPLPPLYCATCFARFWTAQGLQKHIEVHKNDMVTTNQTNSGVAGKCISCGHRVPNILLHMRMVHNRELRHYLAALMCIFCGNRFLTKKETENHMSKQHGVIVKNSNVQTNAIPPKQSPQTKGRGGQQSPGAPAPKPSPGTSGAAKGAGGKMNRSSQCVLCNLTFQRNVDLTRHCMRVHHTCMKCGLVVVDKESLSRHTCLHSASGMRDCQICKETGFHPAYYIKHMRDKHLRKCSVVLRRIDRAVVETMKRPITISDSEEDEPSCKPSQPKQQKQGAGHSDTGVKGKTTGGDTEADSSAQNVDEGSRDRDGKEAEEKSAEEEDPHPEDIKTGDQNYVSKDRDEKEVGKKSDKCESDGDDNDSSVEKKQDQVPDENDDGEDKPADSEPKENSQDKDSYPGEEDSSKGQTRLQNSDEHSGSNGKHNSDDKEKGDKSDDKGEGAGDKSDDGSDGVSQKKRKADKSDNEDGAVRKSLRRSGSKGSESMDQD